MLSKSGGVLARCTLQRTLPALLASLLLTACGSGSGSGNSDTVVNPPGPGASNPAPELTNLSPQTINQQVSQGDSVQAQIGFSNSGDANLTYTLSTSNAFISLSTSAQGTLAPGQNATLSIGLTCSSGDESGAMRLQTNDPAAADIEIPVVVECLAPTPLNVARLTLNQGARAYDSDAGDVVQQELVAGRDLLVRAFLTGSNPPPTAEVVIAAAGGGEQRFPMQTPTSIGSTPAAESSLAASHHVVVPAASVQPGSTLRIEGANGSYPDSPIYLNVQDPGVFRITFVPVTFGGQTPDIDGEAYLRQTLRQLPIGDYDIEIRTPYVFNGDYELDRLLEEMLDLRALDGSSRLYHGIIVSPNTGSQTAGIAYVGFPASVSIDLGGSQNVISHEIGHNLDLSHAPGCDAPNTDAAYPYADGAVTTWGYDILSGNLVSPSATRKDLMTYCADLWISDYSFQQALAYRVQSPIASGPAGGSLLVRGRIRYGEVHDVQWLPLDQATPASSTSDYGYELRGWDASGSLLGSFGFDAHRFGHGEPGAGFAVVLPASMAAMHHYEILAAGQVIHAAQVALASSEPELTVRWGAESAHVQWAAGGAGRAMLVRNPDGQVIAVDRSGDLQLPRHVAATALLELRTADRAQQRWQMFTDRQPSLLRIR